MRRRNDFVSTLRSECGTRRILQGDYALPAGLAANDLILHHTNRPARQPDGPFLFACECLYSHSKITKLKERV
ncbi:hypothetical protein F3P66_19910 [Agrobacterium fabrum]|uniref:Uncharacterized protein n=1 Tax=Agrobacterium fabrum (strain C58 / ATCC 33970) TaxID=176299 RepID=Q8U8M5_AGRFC|nr:hypothetical protein Atu4065 [Agrobacterium fabrum str. C58]QKW99227.1 hypothetical protein GSF67_18955 [Agrobacterium sp. CGMCC 11546]QRM61653.1 hypothetical protein F3P66_19910 [Agrobacterium fabrum]TRB24269.1 hypothetical protein EXN51_24715 [Agrobacterium fabrum]